MADLSDVEQGVASAITSILYPAGSSQLSIIGALCRIYRGWPNSATLNSDLIAGVANVTVGSDNQSGRITTRYLPEWQTTSSQPGVTANVIGETIAVSGYPAVGDLIGALIDGVTYVYRVRGGDTAGLVASNLSQLIETGRSAGVEGSNVTVPGANSIRMRVGCDCAATFESRRQEKDVRIICWCPTPPIRDYLSAAIDSALDQMSFLTLPDATSARVIYRNTDSYDQAQNALLYRRDLVYSVEYPTVSTVRQPSMAFGASGLNGSIKYG